MSTSGELARVTRARHCIRARWRHPHGRGASKSLRQYQRATADALAAKGYGTLARSLLQCGTLADVRSCRACGDAAASVEVNAGCGSRACPWCARREAHERSELVAAAAERVAGYAALDARRRRPELAAELEALEAPGRRKTAKRDRRRASIRRALHALGGQGVERWGWKLVTIAPKWDPAAAWSYGVEGLRARLEDVQAKWRELWRAGLDVEGLAGAYARVENSITGHVHLHALYFGPWFSDRWAATVAGCFVDVRAVKARELAAAVKEAVKYTLKSPSPLRGAWVAGAHYRTPHPELAASWVLATRHRRTVEAYGVFRRALSAELATQPDGSAMEKPRACSSCGSCELSDARKERVAELARVLGVKGWTFRGSARGAIHGNTALPARIAVVRV